MRPLLSLILILFTSLLTRAAIYGEDNRQDLLNSPATVQPLFKSIAITVANNFLTQNTDGSYSLGGVDRLSGFVCPTERFFNQNSIDYSCSGFLISDQILMTAGHCLLPNGVIDHDEHPPFCEGFSWYFGYDSDASGKSRIQNIPADQIYHCTQVIRAENLDHTNASAFLPGNDFALLVLDRPVARKIPRLKLNPAPLKIGQNVFTIGHPSGLPSKYSGPAAVSRLEPVYYGAYLDTQGGNSGGPVFNEHNEVVGILVGGHPIDYTDTPSGCQKANVCDARGLNCFEDSPYSFLPTWNQIQYLNPALPYIR